MRRLVTDTLVVAERNLVRLPRAPDLLLAFTVQPVMFVLLFVYVFGGAISTPGLRRLRRLPDARDHRPEHRLRRLRHGARPQRGPAEGPDRPLPLAADGALRRARRAARWPTSSTNSLSVLVLVVTGLIIGFSFDASLLEILGGLGLLLLFGYAFSWVFALLGLLVSSPEAANSLGFIAVFPLTFISSAFVPVESMPSALRGSPRSTRSRSSSTRCARCGSAQPAGNSVWGAVVWSLVIIAVFAPLAVSRYRRAAGH